MTRAPFTLVPMAVAALAVGSYDNYTEVSFGVPNPDFGRVISYQAPRSLRVGAASSSEWGRPPCRPCRARQDRTRLSCRRVRPQRSSLFH